MRLLLALLVCGVLAGCQTMRPSKTVGHAQNLAAADAAQQQRAQALGLGEGACLQPGWTLAGRAALSNGEDGGSGRLEWTQGAGQLRLQLSAPITRKTWILDVDASGASLLGLPDGERHAEDPEQLLQAATGWDIPIKALGCWLRAVAANPAQAGAARIEYAADLLPLSIEQGGWRIVYSRWQLDPFSRLPMPSRIEATRGASKVKLAVDRWGLE